MPRLNCWRLIVLLLVALGSVMAPQVTGGADEPAAKPEPGSEYHEYYLPLKGRPENLPGMMLVGPDAEKCVRFEPAGMRITLPAGFEGHRPQVGLSTGIVVKGDFEITVSFEILEEPKQEDSEDSTPLSLWVYRRSGDKCITGLCRRATVSNGTSFAAYAARFESSVGKTIPTMGEMLPTDAKIGRLRMVRIDGDLSYYTSEGTDANFTLVTQFPIGKQDLDDLRLIAFTGGPRAFLDGRFWDLRIRMGSLPPVEAASEKETRSRGWLGAAGVMGVILLLLIGLTLFLRHRRSRVVALPGTIAKDL